MPLSRDDHGGGTDRDGAKSETYCSHCYRSRQFVMPDITVHDMQKRVKARLVEVGTAAVAGSATDTQDPVPEAVEERLMTRVTFGVLLGLVIGAVDVGLMVPLSFPDKRAALLGAFFARFALGFFAATVRLPMSPVASGLVVGIVTSVPDAIITEAYAPILVTGIVFGAIAGWVVGRWAPPL
jgi:hypothetical protein